MLVAKQYRFEASHILPAHPGKCARLHGHSYQVEVAVCGRVHEESGFVVDYAWLDEDVTPIIDQLDHQHLNHLIENPSAENVAGWIGCRLKAGMGKRPDRYADVDWFEVRVRETARTSATWHSVESPPLMPTRGVSAPPVAIEVSATNEAAELEQLCRETEQRYEHALQQMNELGARLVAAQTLLNQLTAGVDFEGQSNYTKLQSKRYI